jgi:predicted DCC family thiol-disulfide oxidoreductase YuxK
MKNQPVILFDGVCNLCQSSVQFIIKRDKKAKFKFAALQSEAGQKLLEGHSAPGLDSVILAENDKIYTHSSAALRIAKELDGLWPMLYVFVIIPRPLRNLLYNWVATNRYRWFGKQESCMMPTPELRSRFL